MKILMKHVFIPLETRNELKQTLQKFISQIEHSSQQVSGTVSIELPDIVDQIDDETAIHDYELMEKYENQIEEWTKTIKTTIAVLHISLHSFLERAEPEAGKELGFGRHRAVAVEVSHAQHPVPAAFGASGGEGEAEAAGVPG